MKLYYQDSYARIFHGDCREVDATVLSAVDVVITDPPYGISHPCDFKRRGRGNLADCVDYPDVHGDDVPFDPSFFLAMGKPLCLWGANHFADRLPSSSGWLVWDKYRPADLDQSTAELAWTNFVKGVRVFRHLWNGMMRASERGESYHPTQKPVALMRWVLSLPWTPPGLVFDPYMGSGPTLRAAKDLGRQCVGVEVEERYCEIAAQRLAQMVLPLSFGDDGG